MRAWSSRYYDHRRKYDAMRHQAENSNSDNNTSKGDSPQNATSQTGSSSLSRKRPHPDDATETVSRPRRSIVMNTKLNSMVPSTPKRAPPSVSKNKAPATIASINTAPAPAAQTLSRLHKFPAQDVLKAIEWVTQRPRPHSEYDVVNSWMEFAKKVSYCPLVHSHS